MKKSQKEKIRDAQVKRRAVNITPEQIWGVKEVQESPDVMCLLANMRTLNTAVAGIRNPTRLAELLYDAARTYTKRNPSIIHVLDTSVEDSQVQFLMHPYREGDDHVIAIRMESADWNTLLRQARPVSTGVSA